MDGKNSEKLEEINNVFLPDVEESLRLDFKAEEREKFYVETWERCLERADESLEKQQKDLENYFKSGIFCKVKVYVYVCGSPFKFPIQQSFRVGLRKNVGKFCQKVQEENKVSKFLRVATVKQNKITKVFEPSEKFSEENLRGQTIVLYDVSHAQNVTRFIPVNLFDYGSKSFFGFPFLFEKPTQNTSYSSLQKKLSEQLSNHLTKKSARLTGSQLESWWIRECNPADNKTDETDTTFDAHKLILIARSDVFQAMLCSPTTKESITNQLLISDIKPTIVKKMLEFMYTNNCDNIELSAVELFMIADKYFLPVLKSRASDAIRRQHLPKLRHSLYLAAVGDLYNEKNLVDRAIEQILPSLSVIIKTAEWKNFSRIHSAMAIKILSRAVPTD
jgi:hypothetical protein